MTNKKAINIIKSECYVFNPLNFDRSTMVNTALDMAVQALEQETCEDAVSRQAMHIELEKWITYGEYKYSNATKYLYDRIDRLPSVKPQYTEEEIQKIQDLEQAQLEKAYELGKAEQTETGHWILYRDHKNMVDYPQCDNCGVIIKLSLPIDNLNYCPNCGRRMIESEG